MTTTHPFINVCMLNLYDINPPPYPYFKWYILNILSKSADGRAVSIMKVGNYHFLSLICAACCPRGSVKRILTLAKATNSYATLCIPIRQEHLEHFNCVNFSRLMLTHVYALFLLFNVVFTGVINTRSLTLHPCQHVFNQI